HRQRRSLQCRRHAGDCHQRRTRPGPGARVGRLIMTSRRDLDDRKLTTAMFLGIVATVAVAGLALAFVAGPAVAEAAAPGIGLKTAAIIAFCLTLAVMVVMAIAAGDGL